MSIKDATPQNHTKTQDESVDLDRQCGPGLREGMSTPGCLNWFLLKSSYQILFLNLGPAMH